ncbi:exported hypothetical protein [Desulfarculales bacterium]
MKKFATPVLLPLMVLGVLPSWAGDQRDFNVIDHSGYAISFIGLPGG